MITVVTANYKTSRFFSVMEKSIIQNTNSLGEILVGNIVGKISPIKATVFAFRNRLPQGSLSHGTALNALLAKVKTEYTLVIDADCLVVRRGWDELFIPLLDSCDLVGAGAHRKDKATGSKMLHANFIFGKTEHFAGDCRPQFDRNIDTAGRLSINKKILEIPYTKRNAGLVSGSKNCAEYQYAGDSIWRHFGRAAAKGDKYIAAWEKEAEILLGK